MAIRLCLFFLLLGITFILYFPYFLSAVLKSRSFVFSIVSQRSFSGKNAHAFETTTSIDSINCYQIESNLFSEPMGTDRRIHRRRSSNTTNSHRYSVKRSWRRHNHLPLHNSSYTWCSPRSRTKSIRSQRTNMANTSPRHKCRLWKNYFVWTSIYPNTW